MNDPVPADDQADESWKNWIRLAGAQLPAPRAPAPQDGELMLDLAAGVLAAPGPLSVVVLGVTRAIVHLDWPATVDLLALDLDPAVIAAGWTPHPAIMSQVRVAGWDAMPVASGSVDLVVGDCSFNALSDRARYRAVAQECARVLKPGGKAILRFFAPAQPDKSAATAVTEARACPEGRLSHFRLDLAMAIAGDNSGFVSSADIKRVFDRLVPDRAAFARLTGAGLEEIARVIDLPADRFPGMMLNYFGVAEIASSIRDWLVVDDVRYPAYLMGESCPTLCLSPAR